MSKKHKREAFASHSFVGAPASPTEEYSVIKHDLIRLVILNVIYLALVLGLFYSNAKTHYLERWFERVLHF